MEISRRRFVRNMGLGLASMSLNAKALAKNSGGGSEALLVNDRKHPKPAPKGYDRLPLTLVSIQSSDTNEKTTEGTGGWNSAGKGCE